MIALNETNEYAAEVAFTLFDGLTPLTGYTFTLGEVQIRLPGGAWGNATLGKILEKGYGRYVVRLTSAQTTTVGDVLIRAVVGGTQTYFGGDVIGTLGGDIPENSDEGSVTFFLPDEVDPYNNPPLTGHTFVLGEVRMCLPDGVYQDVPLDQIEEVGFGGYRVNLTEANTAKKGKVFVHAAVTGYQTFESYGTILGVGSSETVVVPPTPIPIDTEDSDLHTVGVYKDLITAAVNRLCEYSKSGTYEVEAFTDNVG